MTDTYSPIDGSGAPLSWAVLDRYLAGECTPAEAAAVRQVVERTADGVAFLEALRAGLSGEGSRRFDAAMQLERLRVALEGEEVGSRTLPTSVAIPGLGHFSSSGRVSMRENSAGHGVRGMGFFGKQTLRRWGWSAGTALLAGIALLTVWSPHISDQSSARMYTTPMKRSAVITLTDGTVVMLSPRSRLSTHVSPSVRTVDVDGEAYFTVAQSSHAPFLVRSGNVTVRVLGTNFLVRHNAEEARVRVSVLEGRVYVASSVQPKSGVTLRAGQIGELTDSTTHVSTVDDMAPGTEWVHGQLVFHDTPVTTVLAAMSRWYGYQFHCADSALLARPVTIAVSARSSAEALSALEQVLSVNLTVTGDTIMLTPQPVRPAKGTPRVRSYDIWTPTREVGR